MSRRAATLVGCSLAIGACGARTSLDGSSIYGDSGGNAGRGGSDPGRGGQSAPGGSTASGGSMTVGGSPMGGLAGMLGDAGLPSGCGNAVLEPGEECDTGALNEDCPALLLRQAAFSVPVSPLVTAGNAEGFYAYFSESSHTGYEELGKSRLLLHRSALDESLSLVMHHGIDFDATGISQPPNSYVYFLITTSGLEERAFVVFSDEPKPELQQTIASEFVGDWKFNGNSDGGVIGGLPFPGDWSIVVKPSFRSGIDAWDFVDAGLTYVPLQTTTSLEIIARSSSCVCRLDCTAPRCGDGLLDGGEVCDDGNLIDGDGCNGSCRAY